MLQSDEFLLTPIRALRIEETDWLIRVKVVKKYPIQSWERNGVTNEFFKFDVMDASGKIQITAFTNLVKKFYTKIEVSFLH